MATTQEPMRMCVVRGDAGSIIPLHVMLNALKDGTGALEAICDTLCNAMKYPDVRMHYADVANIPFGKPACNVA